MNATSTYPELPTESARAVGFSIDLGIKILDAEVRLMREMAERNGWTFLRTWVEKWHHWLTPTYHPEFASMLEHLAELKVDVVIVPDGAELSPDPIHRARMIRQIGAAGAIVCELSRTELPRRGRLR